MGEFLEEIESGDERRGLEALRGQLASALIEADVNVVPQVAGRLQAVITRIAELDKDSGEPAKEDEGSTVDELTKQRQSRRSASKVVEAPASHRVKRGRRSS